MSWRKIVFSVGLCLGLLLFLWQVWASYEAVRRELHIVRVDRLAVAAISGLGVYAIQLCGWVMIMRGLNVPLSITQTVEGYLLSFLPRYIPGSVWGYLSRGQWLAQTCGVDYALSTTASVLEAIFFVLASLGLGGLYIFACSPWPVQLALAALWSGLLGLIPTLVQRAPGWFGKTQLNLKLYSLNVPGITLFYVLFWIIYGYFVWSIIGAIFPRVSVNLWDVIFSATLSWFLGFIVVFIPSGIGVRELSLSALLVVCTELTSQQANLIATTSRLGIIVAEMVWLLIGLALYAKKMIIKTGLAKRKPGFRVK